MDVSRLKNSYEILYSDLSRQIFGDANDPKYQKNIDIQDGGLTFTAPILINFNNKKFIVCLSNSLSNERPIEKEIDDYLATGSQNYEVVTVPEILIRKNLPSASKFVNEKIGFVSD